CTGRFLRLISAPVSQSGVLILAILKILIAKGLTAVIFRGVLCEGGLHGGSGSSLQAAAAIGIDVSHLGITSGTRFCIESPVGTPRRASDDWCFLETGFI